MAQSQQNLESAVSTLADYIAATANPKKTIVEAVALLIKMIKAILSDARGHLGEDA